MAELALSEQRLKATIEAIGIKPYAESPAGALYCGDCLEVMPKIPDGAVDCVVTDPPYGVGLGEIKSDIGKNDAYADFQDTEEYVLSVAVKTIEMSLEKFGRAALTPGTRCLFLYPRPREIGAAFNPAGAGRGRWGFTTMNPILYYGDDPYKQSRPNGFLTHAITQKNGHPCPKPIEWMRWLIWRTTLKSETILDPFAGSGTTLVAAKQLGRKYIGIEINKDYCEIAKQRLAQEELF